MRTFLKIAWLVFLSIFPISTLLRDVELDSPRPDGQGKSDKT